MPSTPRRAAIVVAAVLPLVPPLTKQERGAAYFLLLSAGGAGDRPRSSPPAQGSSRCAPSCAPTGEPTLSGAPLSPCFAAESAREGTLMSLSEGAPARSGSGAESGYSKYTFGKRGHPLSQRGKAVSSEVTSGCPKRSEGGFPVGTRTNTAFRADSKRNYT